MPEKSRKPKIRFTGFTEDWEQRKVADEVDTIDTGKSKFRDKDNGEYEILGSTSVIGYSDEYDYEGDFLLTARVGANAGTLYRRSGKVKITDNTVFLQGKNLDFLFYLLSNFDLHKLSFGTGQPLVKASELKSLLLAMPRNALEKKQIGTFFRHLDHLITLHQRKRERLGNIKKAMLEKMFPKNGADVPEVRFAGFTEAWEQRKLGELANIRTGYPFESRYFSDDGKYLVITNGNIQDDLPIVDNSIGSKITISDATIIKKYLLDIGDILVTMDGTVGRTAKVIELGQILAQRVGRITAYQESEFLYQWLNTGKFSNAMLEMSHGGTIKHISLNEIACFCAMTPQSRDEQARIGTFFRHLDHLITLHQRKVELLQNIKKACLETMFV